MPRFLDQYVCDPCGDAVLDKWLRNMQMDHLRDLRATRRWFAAREAGWTPAERVRRAAFYACEPWAE